MSEVILKGICTTTDFEAFERRLFNELKSFKELHANNQEWFTSKEAMEYIRIKETKFYDLISKGIIKQYELDGSKRYNRNELYEVLKNDSL